MRVLRISAGIAMLLLLCACSGQLADPAGSSVSLQAGLPDARSEAPVSIPALSELPVPANSPARESTGVGTYNFGAEDLVSSSRVSMVGPLLYFSGVLEPSFAVFAFDLKGGSADSIHVGGSCEGLYVGVSDYSNQHWRWLSGPLAAAADLSLPERGLASPADMTYILLISSPGVAPSCTLSVEYSDASEAAKGTWNFLVWIAGDNNLAAEGYADLQELESVGSNAYIRLLAGYDVNPGYLESGQTGAEEVHFIKVVADSDPGSINTLASELNQNFPRNGFDSSSPDRLLQFVNWAAQNFPADHTALVLWDHGNGWVTTGSGTVGKRGSGVLSDDHDGTSGKLTNNADIAATLAGSGIELLLFDACNMGQLESLYDYRETAPWLVASECLVPDQGYPYAQALAAWNASYPLPAVDIGALFVSAVEERYRSSGQFVTHAVYRSAELTPLAEALRSLASHVVFHTQELAPDFNAARFSAFEPAEGDGVRDLGSFLMELGIANKDPQLQSLIAETESAADRAIVDFQQFEQPRSTGLAIWLPNHTYFTAENRSSYSSLDFNADSGWLNALVAVGL